MILYFIGGEIDLMYSFALLNGEYQEKIVPVQVVSEVRIPGKFLHLPDFNLSGYCLFMRHSRKLSDGDFFHPADNCRMNVAKIDKTLC